MATRRGLLLGLSLLVAGLSAGGVAALSERGDEGAAPRPSPEVARAAADVTEVGCARGGSGGPKVRRAHDVVLGPLVLVGGRRWATRKPDAFRRHGYKVPVTLPHGQRATLSVPAAMRGRVGLVYSYAAQERVVARGMRGADTAVRFTACAPDEQPGRTGWGGGLVVDHPRCVTLVVEVAGGPTVRRRVPLGRRC